MNCERRLAAPLLLLPGRIALDQKSPERKEGRQLKPSRRVGHHAKQLASNLHRDLRKISSWGVCLSNDLRQFRCPDFRFVEYTDFRLVCGMN